MLYFSSGAKISFYLNWTCFLGEPITETGCDYDVTFFMLIGFFYSTGSLQTAFSIDFTG